MSGAPFFINILVVSCVETQYPLSEDRITRQTMASSTAGKPVQAKPKAQAKTDVTASASPRRKDPKSAPVKAEALKPAPRVPHIPAPPAKPEAISEAVEERMTPGLELKKQELIDKVVEASGIKKKDAKPVVDALLDILGAALAEGRELNLSPLGKIKQNRVRETANARIIIAKIRQGKTSDKPSDPLADAAE